MSFKDRVGQGRLDTPAWLHTDRRYPCGCSASGPGDVPAYCPTHGPRQFVDSGAFANGTDTGETKPSNPKDAIGSRKGPLGLVPDTIVAYAAEALLEGALKYGRFNWRICGVRAHIYHDALERHLAKWWNGQDHDPKTKVHHLASIIACAGIMLDAELYGKFVDDRPPCPNPDALADLIDSLEERVAQLREVFKDERPYQFTIADTRKEI